jgi:c-di-GMP-binding flagellar brake protein YcgR
VVRFEGADALRAPLPGRLLRLQRRGFYRLPGASINALMKCEIVRGDDAQKILRPAVIDISCGGMAIDIPTADGLLADDTRHTCTLDFVGLGRVDTPLLVHGSREVTLGNGSPGRRYGIEFLNLEVKSIAIIQRFINDEERRLIRGNRR